MDDKNRTNSWNPLNYSQNLCVVSNTSGAGNHMESSLPFLSDSMSGLDLTSDHSVHDFDNKFNCNQSLQTVSTRRLTDPFFASNGLNCGHFGLNVCDKSDATALPANGLNHMKADIGFNGNTNHSAFNPNSIQFIPSSDLMSNQCLNTSSRLYNRFPQPLNSMTDLLPNPMPKSMSNTLTDSVTKSLANPMSNRINTSLSSAMNGSNESQSLIMPTIIGCKSQPSLPYRKTYPHMMSTQEASHPMNRQMRAIRSRNVTTSSVEPLNKVNYYLDKSYEQFKHLERERKKIECEMTEVFVGQKISSANNIPIQRLPQNATKMDKILTDMSREHAKVITIMAKMEQLRERELDELVHNSVHNWVQILRDLQMKRKYEMSLNEEICHVLKQLSVCIRTVRTVLWCASVVTLYQN